MLLVNYVGWLLYFSVESMIRDNHEYKLIWNNTTPGEEMESKREPGNPGDWYFFYQKFQVQWW